MDPTVVTDDGGGLNECSARAAGIASEWCGQRGMNRTLWRHGTLYAPSGQAGWPVCAWLGSVAEA